MLRFALSNHAASGECISGSMSSGNRGVRTRLTGCTGDRKQRSCPITDRTYGQPADTFSVAQ